MNIIKNKFLYILIGASLLILGTCAFLIKVDIESLKHNQTAVYHDTNTIKHLLIIENSNQKVQNDLREIQQILKNRRDKYESQKNR